MKILVDDLPDDWLAWALRDRDVTVMHKDGSNSVRREQVILVRRGGVEYEERRDLGLTRDCKHEPLWIWAGGRTRVGKVRDMAARARGDPTFGQEQGLETPDLRSLWVQYVEEQWAAAKHRSVFGPEIVRVRR